jgi:hypothetical protein
MTTTQYELDNGILETLMSSASSMLNSINNISYNNNNNNYNNSITSTTTTTPESNTASSSKSSSKKQISNKKNQTWNTNTTTTTTTTMTTTPPPKRLLPVLQVLNIQNIASPIVNFNGDASNATTQSAATATSASASTTDSSATVASTKLSSSLSSDRYLLILSDGIYYETTCLLLPNLNYLINESKLRKGSIIRLDRYELNTIHNGKVLVIEELTVLKNATLTDDVVNQVAEASSSSSSSNTVASSLALSNNDENERKSIMNNNLAETLRSIGIIGNEFTTFFFYVLRMIYEKQIFIFLCFTDKFTSSVLS